MQCELKNAYNKSGFAGHFVVVIGYDHDLFVIHDPGPPAQEYRQSTK